MGGYRRRGWWHSRGAPQAAVASNRPGRPRAGLGRVEAMIRSAASQHFSAHAPTVSAEAQRVLSVLLNDQRQRWRRGERVLVESYLTSMATLQEDREGLLDLICNEVVLRAEKGDVPQLGEYLRRFEAYQQR